MTATRERVQIGAAAVYHGDCIAIAPMLDQVDAIVTDPPYHLTSGNISFDWNSLGPNGIRQTNMRGRKTGFMGQHWDGGDIAFRPETWATIGTALKPGGYLLAFGGTRTHHRIWCAIEDAGFVIQDTIMWLHGSGFPKGRSHLKPAHEPICVAYKPGGTRTLQIEECRIGLGGGYTNTTVSAGARRDRWEGNRSTGERIDNGGRWPANICHSGSDEVMGAFAAFRLDKESPARFYYAARASKADRAGSKHPTVKPVALMRWLVRLVTPLGGILLDPFAGSGTTGAAALADGRKVILIERELEYIADIKRRLRACCSMTETGIAGGECTLRGHQFSLL